MKTFPKGTNIIIICGHHHQGEGLLGETESSLKLEFNSMVKCLNQELAGDCEDSDCEEDECDNCENGQVWRKKQISIETFFLDTKKDENGDSYVLDQSSKTKIKVKFSELISNESPLALIFASCWSTYSPVNTVLRACGLYSVLTLKKDRGEISKVFKLDERQIDNLKYYAEFKPKHVLLVGDYGSGKTLFGSEIVKMKVSSLEIEGVQDINLIIIADIKGEKSQLLEDFKAKYLTFIELEINVRRRKMGRPEIQPTFVTLHELYRKYNILPDENNPRDQEVLKILSKRCILNRKGWSNSFGSVTEKFYASSLQIPNEGVQEEDLLKQLNNTSNYKGAITIDWLRNEMCEKFFVRKNEEDSIGTLRQIRQEWLHFHFWEQYHRMYLDPTCLSFKLKRLLEKMEFGNISGQTIIMLDEFKLDFGAAGFTKREDSVELNWKSSCKMDLVIAVEPCCWQDFEFSEKDKSGIREQHNTMIFYLPTKYRTSGAIDSYVTKNYNHLYKFYRPKAMLTAENKIHELTPEGEKPIWIELLNIEQEKDALSRLLKSLTACHKEIIWTCCFESDKTKFKGVCDIGWTYIKENELDGTEAECILIFGLPFGSESVSSKKMTRLLTRARNLAIIVTERSTNR